MNSNRQSGEIYKREDGLKLLGYLGLLNDDIADYILSYFSSMASGPDLLSATRVFYALTIVQLVKTGEFVPGEIKEEENNEFLSPVVQSRADRFDQAVKGTELNQKLESGMSLDIILHDVDVSKYLKK